MTQYAPPPPAGMPYPSMPPGPAGMSYGGPPPVMGYGGYSPPPPVRRSHAGRIAGVVVGVLVVLVVGFFAFVMAFGAPVVTDDQVEQQITNEFGLAPGSVSCPNSLEGEVGAQMTCTATDGGTSAPVLVQVTSVEGDTVNFTMTVQ
jgi:Domain of unknown function (DUF4333)